MERVILNNMALIRVISGMIEIVAAMIFLKVGRVDTALRLNAILGLIGPLIFLAVSVLGIAAIAVKLSWTKVVLISLGIILVLIGTKSS
ncbi:MAG TPA: DUF2619 domain-containing protein [Bacillota bacterium]